MDDWKWEFLKIVCFNRSKTTGVKLTQHSVKILQNIHIYFNRSVKEHLYLLKF